MKITIKQFNVDMEIKNKGIELQVKDPQGSHLGDLIVTKTKLIWCSGREGKESAMKKKQYASWLDFIGWMEG